MYMLLEVTQCLHTAGFEPLDFKSFHDRLRSQRFMTQNAFAIITLCYHCKLKKTPKPPFHAWTKRRYEIQQFPQSERRSRAEAASLPVLRRPSACAWFMSQSQRKGHVGKAEEPGTILHKRILHSRASFLSTSRQTKATGSCL